MLILCGMPGVGKTTIGKGIAEELNWPFIDTDQLIEQKHGKTVRELYQELGEKAFREIEKEVIQGIEKRQQVVSTGGGTFDKEENRILLKGLGQIVYLQASIEFLLQRPMPAYLNGCEKGYRELAAKRIPIFEQIADEILNAEEFPNHSQQRKKNSE